MGGAVVAERLDGEGPGDGGEGPGGAGGGRGGGPPGDRVGRPPGALADPAPGSIGSGCGRLCGWGGGGGVAGVAFAGDGLGGGGGLGFGPGRAGRRDREVDVGGGEALLVVARHVHEVAGERLAGGEVDGDADDVVAGELDDVHPEELVVTGLAVAGLAAGAQHARVVRVVVDEFRGDRALVALEVLRVDGPAVVDGGREHRVGAVAAGLGADGPRNGGLDLRPQRGGGAEGEQGDGEVAGGSRHTNGGGLSREGWTGVTRGACAEVRGAGA